jgi:hypothetical protein
MDTTRFFLPVNCSAGVSTSSIQSASELSLDGSDTHFVRLGNLYVWRKPLVPSGVMTGNQMKLTFSNDARAFVKVYAADADGTNNDYLVSEFYYDAEAAGAEVQEVSSIVSTANWSSVSTITPTEIVLPRHTIATHTHNLAVQVTALDGTLDEWSMV